MSHLPDYIKPTDPRYHEFVAWFNSRPAVIQDLIRRFQFGSKITLVSLAKVEVYYVVGWNEGNMVICGPISPDYGFEAAVTHPGRVYVCADHFSKTSNGWGAVME